MSTQQEKMRREEQKNRKKRMMALGNAIAKYFRMTQNWQHEPEQARVRSEIEKLVVEELQS